MMQRLEMPGLVDTPVVPGLLGEIKGDRCEGVCKVEWRDNHILIPFLLLILFL